IWERAGAGDATGKQGEGTPKLTSRLTRDDTLTQEGRQSRGRSGGADGSPSGEDSLNTALHHGGSCGCGSRSSGKWPKTRPILTPSPFSRGRPSTFPSSSPFPDGRPFFQTILGGRDVLAAGSSVK